MTTLKTRLFPVLLLILLPIFVYAGQVSEFSLASGICQIAATSYRQGLSFGENDVLNFRSSPGGNLLKTMKSYGFEQPVLFRYHGEKFVHVSTTPAGSGGFENDWIFWIAPDATMHEIDIEDAAEAYEDKVDQGETVLAGGSGLNCTGGQLKFAFYIARDGDPHCCPTAGKVTGSYKIVGASKFDPITKQYSSTFKMMVLQQSRTSISSGEVLANLAR